MPSDQTKRPIERPPSEGSARPAAERVPLRTVLCFGPPIFGLSALVLYIQFFFLKFATDVLLMAPATVGVIFALGRAWDAVTDPIAGTLSDRTQTRLGRRRPWMLAAIPALALTFAMTWIPPRGLTGPALTAWVAVALFAFYTAFTAYVIPHSALGAELTTDHHDRSRIFGVRHASFTLGIMLAFAGMQFVENSEDQRAAAASLALLAGVVLSLVLLIPPTFVRERPGYLSRGAKNPFHAMADVLRNPHARILVSAIFLEMAGAGVLGVLSPYVTVYIVKRPDLIGPLPAIFVVFSLLSIPVWVRASRRFGKSNVWRVALVGLALSFGGCFFIGEGDVALMAGLLVGAGLSFGCGGAISLSILADVIDYDEYQSGERKEGSYAAAHGFAIKAANAAIILLVGLVLQLSGFEPNVDQSPTTKLAIRSMFAGVPLVMFGLGAVLLRRFRLDHDEHARIRAELDNQNS